MRGFDIYICLSEVLEPQTGAVQLQFRCFELNSPEF